MFPKSKRFSFKKKLPKNILSSPSFSLRFERSDEGLKVAVVVSKRVDKRATIRNKIKRRIIDIIQKEVKIEKQFNLVFYVKKQALYPNNLEKEITEAISRIK